MTSSVTIKLNVKDAPSAVLKDENTLQTSWVANPYINAATSSNTRKAYRCDIQHFENWGGTLPATAESIAAYLKAYAARLNHRTLARRLIALKHWHNYQGFNDPTSHPAIQKTIKGITRLHGKPKVKAYPLTLKDLKKIISHLSQSKSLAASRDSALLQMGFLGAFRRSELVQICVEHLEWKEEGIDVLIPGSKTDQEHAGQYAALPYGNQKLCPIVALKNWLELSTIQKGPIFRELKKGGILKDKPLTAYSVNLILRKRAAECGLIITGRLSSHSLRRGLATSASLSGANLAAIMRQGRWKQVNTVMEYIEASERFRDNAASKLLEEG